MDLSFPAGSFGVALCKWAVHYSWKQNLQCVYDLQWQRELRGSYRREGLPLQSSLTAICWQKILEGEVY